ncbi:MAG: hypothetical protein LDLANPLL_01214 [Turneriella sp.]|nr:hypothetical protein [Turneriella sp.]
MCNIGRVLAIVYLGFFSIPLHASDVIFPKTLGEGKPGKYEIHATSEFMAYAGKGGVRALLYIPPTIPKANLSTSPIVVFFHGNSKNKNTYKSAADVFYRYAQNKKFLVLSVQNWWPLSGDMVEAAEDSRQATNLILNRLAQIQIGDTKRVFVTGFSAGGLTALLTFIKSIDNSVEGEKELIFFNYAGMASFKGNFYPQFLEPMTTLDPSAFIAYFTRLMKGKAVILTVGGKKDAPRVQKQQPEARQVLLEQYGITAIFKEFPTEGHVLTPANLDLLWQAMGLQAP